MNRIYVEKSDKRALKSSEKILLKKSIRRINQLLSYIL